MTRSLIPLALTASLLLPVAAPAQAPLSAAPDSGAAAPVATIGRLHYDGGGDWYANPSSLPNLLEAIRTRTTLRVARPRKGRDPLG